jgi:hypothetical protein
MPGGFATWLPGSRCRHEALGLSVGSLSADDRRGGFWCSVTLGQAAGLNSTPALINMIVFVICSQVLRVPCTRSNRKRGSRRGQVGGMRSVNVKVSGRLAAPS